ncbi:MAG: hypothetical protein KDD58_00330 [Bdellovibrionales bacterium]|nr:hypothetical protein [Bdellovibrionales bacterium]
MKKMWLSLLFLTLQSYSAYALDWNLGLKGGFGGTGIQKTVETDDGNIDANRSEGPAVVGIGLEKNISDKLSFAIEHRRGFRFGPFTSGVGFTDATWRWYYMGVVPAIVPQKSESYFFTKKWSYFLGGAAGLAFGEISREGEKIKKVKSSGVTIGIKIGADLHYRSDMVIRSEIVTSSTFMNASVIEESMSEFGLLCGVLFSY